MLETSDGITRSRWHWPTYYYFNSITIILISFVFFFIFYSFWFFTVVCAELTLKIMIDTTYYIVSRTGELFHEFTQSRP